MTPTYTPHTIHQKACSHEELCFHRSLCQHHYEFQHVCNVSFLVFGFCSHLGLTRQQALHLSQAAFFHDTGKANIPQSILAKPSAPSPEEWAMIRTHPQQGYEILSQSLNPHLRNAAEVALYHHERWDGSGYPFGLVGEEIPLGARIVAICDVYESLRGQRPYRHPLGHQEAMEIMVKGDGRTQPHHFDPDLLDLFRQKAESLTLEMYFDQAKSA